MEITKNDILSELILSNYRLLKVIERYGVKLGIGNLSIQQVCEMQNLNPDLLCLILNMFSDSKFSFPESSNFQYVPPLINYLEKSHEYFLNDLIPEIRTEISKLVYIITNPNGSLIKKFFDNYIKEVNAHMNHENKVVFKYVSSLYESYLKGNKKSNEEHFSIDEYEMEHEDIEQVLMDLKNLLLKHVPQGELEDNRFNVLLSLFELEHELYSHQKIEDDFLVPLIKGLELEMSNIRIDV